MKLTEDEIKGLREYGYDIDNMEEPDNQLIYMIIIISGGRENLHESRYPYIQVLGVCEWKSKGRRPPLVNLGQHDLFLFNKNNVSLHIDSLGKNIFRVFDINKKVSGNCKGSTLFIGDVIS
jgi:hypothetical protein